MSESQGRGCMEARETSSARCSRERLPRPGGRRQEVADRRGFPASTFHALPDMELAGHAQETKATVPISRQAEPGFRPRPSQIAFPHTGQASRHADKTEGHMPMFHSPWARSCSRKDHMPEAFRFVFALRPELTGFILPL
jgi:hypothetical protein